MKSYLAAMGNIWYVFVTVFLFSECWGYASSSECPLDCLCYSDFLHNLESWRWVEPDVHIDEDNPEHERFNPYTSHNEVFENPMLEKRRQRESILSTITCMIRSNGNDTLEDLFRNIPVQTQVMSLIQAPGSGSVTLRRSMFKRFHLLVGLEVKGYSTQTDTTLLTGDALAELSLLSYLNLEMVELEHESVENDLHDSVPRILRINYTYNDIVTNEITSQLLVLTPDFNDQNDSVLPYYEYKKVVENERHQAPLEPKFRVAFTALPKLQHLKISGCNLHDISWDMFYKLDNLKYLLLDENDLLFLPDFVFYATSNLTVLSLSNNKILNLQTVGLAGLLYLQKLDVTRNNITHLSELSLPPFPHLEVADFRYNPISSIFPNTFEIMNSTKTLYLGSPDTTLDLSANSFYGLTSLNKLDIANIKIRLLEKPMLGGMPQLRTLIMTGKIPRISFDAFGEVNKLERLILRNCGIKKISMDAFFGLNGLKELDLSHNSLSFLPPGIFEEQVSLREVFLQHNKLTTLPVNLIQDLPVKILRLEGNPWHCTCDMRSWDPQIVNRVKRYHIPTPNTTLCQKTYDKGSMCFETYEPRFEVIYSYEKRVSPVCDSPLKLNQRSVFQVLRKELRYCKHEGKKEGGETNIKKKSNFPENYSVNTLQALEKQLLAKPVKPKKNRQEEQPVSNNSESNAIGTVGATNTGHNLVATLENQGNDVSTSKKLPGDTVTFKTKVPKPSLADSNSRNDTGGTPGNLQISLSSQISERSSTKLEPVDSSPWLPTITTKSKQKDKKKSKTRLFQSSSDHANTLTNAVRTRESSILPQISSKSLKLNRQRTSG